MHHCLQRKKLDISDECSAYLNQRSNQQAYNGHRKRRRHLPLSFERPTGPDEPARAGVVLTNLEAMGGPIAHCTCAKMSDAEVPQGGERRLFCVQSFKSYHRGRARRRVRAALTPSPPGRASHGAGEAQRPARVTVSGTGQQAESLTELAGLIP
jgi:hypothetical protein